MIYTWRRRWHPTPVLLPGESHGRRSLVGCNPWGREGLDTTEWLHFLFSLSCIGEGNGNPLHCSCLENPRDGEAWWAAVYGVAQSQTWLKRQQQQYKIKNLKKLSFMKPVPSAKRLGIADLTIISKLNIHPGVTCTSAVGSGWFFHNIVRYALYILFKTMN